MLLCHKRGDGRCKFLGVKCEGSLLLFRKNGG